MVTIKDLLTSMIEKINSKVRTINGIEPDENGNVEITTLNSGGNANYILTLSTDEADAQANSDAVTAAIAEHKRVALKTGKYPVKPGIVIESGKLDMNGAHFYTVDYKSSTPLVYLKGEAPEICNGELEGSYDLADDEEGYSFFEGESLIHPEGVNEAYIHHMDLHNNWGYCIKPGENVERVYVGTATITGTNNYFFTTDAFDIPEGYKFVTAAGGIGYGYIISVGPVTYRFYDESGKQIRKSDGVPRKRISIPSGAKTVTFETKLNGDTFVAYHALFTNYEETLTVADCKLHNFHSLGMANFPGPTTVTRCSFFEGGKPRSEANGTSRATTGGIDIEDVQTPEFIMTDCRSRDCEKMLMFGGYKGVISNCVGDKIGIYRGWQCDLSNCNVDHLYTMGSRCRISLNGVHADSIDIKESNRSDLRGNISLNTAHGAGGVLSYLDSFIIEQTESAGYGGTISGRLKGVIRSYATTGLNIGISSEKGSRIVVEQNTSSGYQNYYGTQSVAGDTYGLISNAPYQPNGYSVHDSIFNISVPATVYSIEDGDLNGKFENCVFNLTEAAYFRKFIGKLTQPISLTFENCIINNADNYMFNFVPDAGGTVTFKNCTIADESKLFNGDASSMTVNILSGGEGGVSIDAFLSVEGAAADAKAVGDALKDKQPAGTYAKSVNGKTPDENGNVKVEAFGDSWELIYYGEITEDVTGITVDKDSDGNAFSLKEYHLVIKGVVASENPSNSFSWYSHNDDYKEKGPFYTILGANGDGVKTFYGRLCGNCWYCETGQYKSLCQDGGGGPSAVPVYKLKLAANANNAFGAGTKVALFGVRA